MRGSGANTNGMNDYTLASGYASNIFVGDLVTMNAGNIEVYNTVTTDKIVGVFMGVSYTADGEPKWSKYWPASTSASDIVVNVQDDPSATYIIQADASVTAGDLNSITFDVTLGAGSTVTGRSGFGMKAGTRGDDLAIMPIAIHKIPGNAAGDAFPKVEVRLIDHIDAYVTVGVSAG
jgi:hypothetical protein